ncbi:MAG: bestrophin family ion channel [Bacteroidota bacterium]
MQSTRRYSIGAIIRWQKKVLLILLVLVSIPVLLYSFFGWEWLKLPWQPIGLIGIAVSFYLGFKNNSSYDRLWEGRKIWGGIVNASRSFTVMARDFVETPEAKGVLNTEERHNVQKSLVHRHVAWLYALSFQMRKPKKWEHFKEQDENFRVYADTNYEEEKFTRLKPYLSEEEYEYLMTKGNKASHLLSLQSKHIMALRNEGFIDGFLHQQLQGMITEFYTLMGKSERIKNFPFPRQYAGINLYFVFLFVFLIPFGMLSLFSGPDDHWIWLSIPFSFISGWVFITMEMIGDYSENPFEGLYNDVPILNISRGIEIDIRQMLEEVDLPAPTQPVGDMKILV